MSTHPIHPAAFLKPLEPHSFLVNSWNPCRNIRNRPAERRVFGRRQILHLLHAQHRPIRIEHDRERILMHALQPQRRLIKLPRRVRIPRRHKTDYFRVVHSISKRRGNESLIFCPSLAFLNPGCLPKVISEMVAIPLPGIEANPQVCPTISETTFGKHYRMASSH